MVKKNRLTKKQIALIEDLVACETDEKKLLDKHKVKTQDYSKWFADQEFVRELKLRITGGYRQSAFVLARNARNAADELVLLTKCEKEETARKACMDIITMNPTIGLPDLNTNSDNKIEEEIPVSPKAVSRLLAVLAEEND